MMAEVTTSESEEMYLIHIAMAGEEGVEGPVGLSRMAEMLSVSPVSVNQMVKKLEARGMVEYLPYKGVELTDAGREIANHVLRRRRLWALFLAEQLGLSDKRADAIACDLEHITPPDLADRLSDLLGDPTSGLQGRPIPNPGLPAPVRTPMILSELPAGAVCTVARVEGSAAIRSFLANEGLVPGAAVTVLAVGGEGDVLVDVDSSNVHLAGQLVGNLLVTLS
ncbi:MAG: metal-dependent transcriptional regulator [Acidimicrobiia bacterium]